MQQGLRFKQLAVLYLQLAAENHFIWFPILKQHS